jgi:hypothetical protein
MTGQSTLDDLALDTNTFYRRAMHVLSEAQVPFLVGGSHAFLHYTGIVRNTKDFDLFVRPEDRDRALEELRGGGYRTEITFPHWLGKAFSGPDFVDVVFGSGNGVCRVDDEWFDNAVESSVLGMPVRLMPAEELIWAKSFIMERERFDGADVVHLIRLQADGLDWDRLMRRFDRHWQLLFSYLVFFGFVYPTERARVPEPVMRELIRRSTEQLSAPAPEDRVCQGTLVSRSQYMIDLGLWGYRDARVAPYGSMTAEEAVYWTWAIENVR